MTAASTALPPDDPRSPALAALASRGSRGDGGVLLAAAALAAFAHAGVLLLVRLPERPMPPAPPARTASPTIRDFTLRPPPVEPPEVADAPRTVRRIPVPAPDPPPVEPIPEREPAAARRSELRLDTGDLLVPTAPVPPSAPGPVPADAPGVVRPVLIPETKVEPIYPELGRQLRSGGHVVLTAVIGRDGTIGDVTVIRATPPGVGFEEAAIEAVGQWRYVPGTLHGRPVEVVVTVLVDFTLR